MTRWHHLFLEIPSSRKFQEGSLMAPAWCVHCDWRQANRYAHGQTSVGTGQLVRVARLLGRPGHPRRCRSTQKQAAASCARCARCITHVTSSDTSNEGEVQERQHLVWKTSFQDHTQWWDHRHQTRNPRVPDFREKESGEPLWLKNCHEPAWLDARAHPVAPAPASLSPDRVDQLVGPGSCRTTELVKKLCKQGQVKAAVEALELLVDTDFESGKNLLYAVLKECVAKKDVMLGGQVHAVAVKMGFGSHTFLCNHFIRMYASHGKLGEAMDVFKGVGLPDAFTWSAIISAHTKQRQAGQAIELYQDMLATGTEPDKYVLVAALQACASAGDLRSGKQVHADVLTCGMEHDVYICTCLIKMYMECGSLKEARRLFDGMEEKNVVTWTVMIAGYAKAEGMGLDALSLYSAMRNEGMAIPDAVTFVCLLQACANVGVSALDMGKQLHSQVKEREFEGDVAVGASLVNMYAKCGSVTDARTLFDGLTEKNVVTWSAMLAGYARVESMGLDALSLHSAMHKEGMAIPDAVTFGCLLQACAKVGVSALQQGRQLHSQIKERGLECDVVVGGALVNMYAKCGSLTDARLVFDTLSDKDVVTWTAMIAGYAQQEGMGQEALNIYSGMRVQGMATPDVVTYVCLLEACVNVGALQQGKELHSEIRDAGFESNVVIGTCLVKMYAQCGRLDVSREVFDRLATKNVETWSALMKGYGEHGEGGMAIQCFEELLEQGMQPDEVTYICLLTACSQAGLVDEGLRYFESMEERRGCKPGASHYACMVDLFGRSGHLHRAEQIIRASGVAGGVVSWTALLSACKSYGDAELGRRCFDHLVKLEATGASAYVLLGSIYANAGRWDEVERVEMMRKAAGARKKAAKACIEVNKDVREFTVGEGRCDVFSSLRRMNRRVKESGHVPQTQLVLRANASEQEKEDALCGHAEKLALAYGLLNTPAGSPLLVTKNLRMCSDCHSSTKIMSRVEKREIVVRDGSRVHRFQDGSCSCQDRP